MTQVPESFKRLVDGATSKASDDRPVCILWVFDPQSGNVILEDNVGKHKADRLNHDNLAERVPHPNRIHGYAYAIQGGWRITTEDHKEVGDRHVVRQVVKSLRERYHDPSIR